MYTYTKIETPFIRDMSGTKKLIEGVFRSEAVEFLSGNQWFFSEKTDGTNTGIYWDGCRVVSHFSVYYNVNVPYRSEDDMANNERMILHHMGEIKKILGVNIKEK